VAARRQTSKRSGRSEWNHTPGPFQRKTPKNLHCEERESVPQYAFSDHTTRSQNTKKIGAQLSDSCAPFYFSSVLPPTKPTEPSVMDRKESSYYDHIIARKPVCQIHNTTHSEASRGTHYVRRRPGRYVGQQKEALVSPSKLTVLLVCKDSVRRDRIRARLLSERHSVITIDLNVASKLELDQNACGTDVAIFDLTERDRRVWDGLRRTTRLRRFDGFPVIVICSSQADHGARFERDVEKLGGRWVYDEAV